MKKEKLTIHGIPAIIWGDKSDRVFVYIHGKDSKKEYAEKLAKEGVSKEFQVISFDLPRHGERRDNGKEFIVQNCVPELKTVYNFVSNKWNEISIYASSIGAYFSLVAFENYKIEKCLFESPILDMETLIKNMMGWFNISEKDLETKKEITTPIGETLSWDYLTYVRENKILAWNPETHIIYGEKDNLTERYIIDSFIKKYNVTLTLVKNGEHYLHSEKEIAEINSWLSKYAI